MATVCAGTMALMDAGVQMVKPVSGIAMGLITDGQNFAVLSDILGDEDHLGDMDFKVTGTKDGITAVSYTHLDVYKRQILKRCLRASFCFINYKNINKKSFGFSLGYKQLLHNNYNTTNLIV